MNTDKIYAESVVNEYSVKTSSKVVALQKLDRWVKHPAKIVAVTFGLVSMILNCSGLAILIELFCFADIGQKLLGIVLYSFGLIGMALTYSVYIKVLEYRKRQNAFDVIELAKEVIEKSE